jgi:hypothetical protein
MSGTPTKPELEQYLITQHAPKKWAGFLHGLPWTIIRPGVKIARNAKVHPAIALGGAARHTRDPDIRHTIQAHLARHAPTIADLTEP